MFLVCQQVKVGPRSQTFPCVNDSEHLSIVIVLAESAEKCGGRKVARESCSSVQDFIEF